MIGRVFYLLVTKPLAWAFQRAFPHGYAVIVIFLDIMALSRINSLSTNVAAIAVSKMKLDCEAAYQKFRRDSSKQRHRLNWALCKLFEANLLLVESNFQRPSSAIETLTRAHRAAQEARHTYVQEGEKSQVETAILMEAFATIGRIDLGDRSKNSETELKSLAKLCSDYLRPDNRSSGKLKGSDVFHHAEARMIHILRALIYTYISQSLPPESAINYAEEAITSVQSVEGFTNAMRGAWGFDPSVLPLIQLQATRRIIDCTEASVAGAERRALFKRALGLSSDLIEKVQTIRSSYLLVDAYMARARVLIAMCDEAPNEQTENAILALRDIEVAFSNLTSVDTNYQFDLHCLRAQAYFHSNDFEQALDEIRLIFDEAKMLQIAYTGRLADRRAIIRRTQSLIEMAAYCFARNGQPLEALCLLVRGCNMPSHIEHGILAAIPRSSRPAVGQQLRLLSQLDDELEKLRPGISSQLNVVGRDPVKMREGVERQITDTLSGICEKIGPSWLQFEWLYNEQFKVELLERMTGENFLTFGVTDRGLFAIFSSADPQQSTRKFDFLEMPELTKQVLIRMSEVGGVGYRRYSSAVGSTSSERQSAEIVAWSGTINEICSCFWHGGLGELSSVARQQGSKSQNLNIILPAKLAAFPIHASGHKDSQGNWISLLDEWNVRYFHWVDRYKDESDALSDIGRSFRILTIDNLRENATVSLLSSLNESQDFQLVNLLDANATIAAAYHACPTANAILFYCHGVNNAADPELSGLLLADGRLLTARTIRQLDLGQRKPIVALAACNSSLPSGSEPAWETDSLPAAFLQAGATAVVAAHWPVLLPCARAIVDSAFYQEAIQPQGITNQLRQVLLMFRDGLPHQENNNHQARYIGANTRDANLSAHWAAFSVHIA